MSALDLSPEEDGSTQASPSVDLDDLGPGVSGTLIFLLMSILVVGLLVIGALRTTGDLESGSVTPAALAVPSVYATAAADSTVHLMLRLDSIEAGLLEPDPRISDGDREFLAQIISGTVALEDGETARVSAANQALALPYLTRYWDRMDDETRLVFTDATMAGMRSMLAERSLEDRVLRHRAFDNAIVGSGLADVVEVRGLLRLVAAFAGDPLDQRPSND